MNIALALALGLATVSPTLAITIPYSDTTEFEVSCDTSEGSPSINDIYKAADEVDGKETCDVGNHAFAGSGCSGLKTVGNAKISICQDPGNDASGDKPGIGCPKVAAMARSLADECPSAGGDKAGGKIDISVKDHPTLAWIEVSKPS